MAEMVAEVEAMGVEFRLAGGKVKASIPSDMQRHMAPLLERLRANREQLVDVLRQRDIPPMPPGVRLIAWNPKQPPVIVERWSVVTDVVLFVRSTLEQLRLALAGNNWLAGNWSVRDLCERLEQVGVRVEVVRGENEQSGGSVEQGA